MPTHTPFRFLVASDLHLEQPLHGLAEVPEHLREAMLEAPFRAAERVFDAALAEQADFLLLAGDVLNAELTGPRGPLFLVEQFQRLREREIAVFWAGGAADPVESCPDWAALPDNVHRFAHSGVDAVVCRRQGWPLARLLGASRDQGQNIPWHDFHPDPTGLFALAAVYAPEVVSVPVTNGIDFWAFGGRHETASLLAERRAAEFPGSPQGRHPREAGPHGCTLVEVDEQRRIERRQLATDVARFWHEEIHVTESHPDQVLELCHQRLQKLLDQQPDILHLVTWRLHLDGPSRPRHASWEVDILERLRTEFGYRSPAAWSIALEIDPVRDLAPHWYQAETFLGDFLRTVRRYQQSAEAELPLERYIGQETDDALRELAHIADREQLLAQVSQLGLELLTEQRESLIPNPQFLIPNRQP